MKIFKTLTATALLLLLGHGAFAQKATVEKQLLGCWKLVEFTIDPAPPNMAEIQKQALNNVICFEKDGKYIGKKSDGSVAGSGTYSVSDDGKVIHQKTEGIPDDQNPPGNIVKLSDTELVISAMEATMRFKKS
ncbi:lipocalin-like domain-containing protein [Flavobacterium selenitireducens]|uniref:lipocalin family protein n=1 Tax=Flavobacterium selenitireducens TaxID=2722704 RepID=UPI00168A6B54|nr:lipocalin family protein [Flavobacterium selenitireducens]MBD3582727.1 lipocalin family protein [Flavobacterium selenitireducens]